MKVRTYILNKISEKKYVEKKITECEQCGNKDLILSLTVHKEYEEYSAYCPKCKWDVRAEHSYKKLETPF